MGRHRPNEQRPWGRNARETSTTAYRRSMISLRTLHSPVSFHTSELSFPAHARGVQQYGISLPCGVGPPQSICVPIASRSFARPDRIAQRLDVAARPVADTVLVMPTAEAAALADHPVPIDQRLARLVLRLAQRRSIPPRGAASRVSMRTLPWAMISSRSGHLRDAAAPTRDRTTPSAIPAASGTGRPASRKSPDHVAPARSSPQLSRLSELPS